MISEAEILLAAYCHPHEAYQGGYIPWEILGWKNGFQCRNYASVLGDADDHFRKQSFDPKFGTSMGSPHYQWCPGRLGYRHPDPAKAMEHWCQGIPKIAQDIAIPVRGIDCAPVTWWSVKAAHAVFQRVHACNHGNKWGLENDRCGSQGCPYTNLGLKAERWLETGVMTTVPHMFPDWANAFDSMMVVWGADPSRFDYMNGVAAMQVLFGHAGQRLHASCVRQTVHDALVPLLLGDVDVG